MARLHDAVYIERTLERLQGTLEGITVDAVISKAELEGLRDWLDIHSGLRSQEPFRDLASRLDAILEDGIVDSQERQDLLEWCHWFRQDQSSPMQTVYASTNQLHGLLQGIAIDKAISPQEVQGLKNWLEDLGSLIDYWPFHELHETLTRILADGVISVSEQMELMEYAKGFSERLAKRENLPDEDYETDPRFSTKAPILESFTAICDRNAVIRFEGRKFCFTGTARSGKRKALFALVEEAGGITTNSMSKSLDYLVIGANSTPAWSYSTYGLKVKSAIDLKKKGHRITILHEDDFIEQIKRKIQ